MINDSLNLILSLVPEFFSIYPLQENYAEETSHSLHHVWIVVFHTWNHLKLLTALNALYLLEYGLELTGIGIMGTIALIPFVIKVFLGMLSDKVNILGLGHRKP